MAAKKKAAKKTASKKVGKKKASKKKLGRPEAFRPEFVEQAYKLTLLGATDKDLADFFSVTEQTINGWKHRHPNFFESITRGKHMADANVAESLYHRALGYRHPEEKIFQNNGEVIRAETVKQYPPDTQAASLWLRNRQSAKWRDKQEVEHSGVVETTSTDDLKAELARQCQAQGIDLAALLK